MNLEISSVSSFSQGYWGWSNDCDYQPPGKKMKSRNHCCQEVEAIIHTGSLKWDTRRLEKILSGFNEFPVFCKIWIGGHGSTLTCIIISGWWCSGVTHFPFLHTLPESCCWAYPSFYDNTPCHKAEIIPNQFPQSNRAPLGSSWNKRFSHLVVWYQQI